MFTRSFANAFTVSILGNTFRKKTSNLAVFPKTNVFFFHFLGRSSSEVSAICSINFQLTTIELKV